MSTRPIAIGAATTTKAEIRRRGIFPNPLPARMEGRA
jgi:hypothetical protein